MGYWEQIAADNRVVRRLEWRSFWRTLAAVIGAAMLWAGVVSQVL